MTSSAQPVVHTMPKPKMFHNGTLELRMFLNPDSKHYHVQIFRKRTSTIVDLYGGFPEYKDAKSVFDKIVL